MANVEAKLWLRNVDEEEGSAYIDIEIFVDNQFVAGETKKKIWRNTSEWVTGSVEIENKEDSRW